MGSDRCPCIGLNPTTYHLDTLPFVEWFKVTHMSLWYPGSRWLHQRCTWGVPLQIKLPLPLMGGS
ncbi:hypothetical protein E2C01_031175 [Portunus trituberculatus]|uniref:Uncharacterized protein n=1 Tax=Portunus trituberculatus TaxID=210409 RepID=A0A5B7EWX9_PORTR|nr:hypothetical protein [Portunus trituberculatus]